MHILIYKHKHTNAPFPHKFFVMVEVQELVREMIHHHQVQASLEEKDPAWESSSTKNVKIKALGSLMAVISLLEGVYTCAYKYRVCILN